MSSDFPLFGEHNNQISVTFAKTTNRKDSNTHKNTKIRQPHQYTHQPTGSALNTHKYTSLHVKFLYDFRYAPVRNQQKKNSLSY